MKSLLRQNFFIPIAQQNDYIEKLETVIHWIHEWLKVEISCFLFNILKVSAFPFNVIFCLLIDILKHNIQNEGNI